MFSECSADAFSFSSLFRFQNLLCALHVFRLQCEVNLQRQQLSDAQHLLQSLRVELQVYEKMKAEPQKHNGRLCTDFDR